VAFVQLSFSFFLNLSQAQMLGAVVYLFALTDGVKFDHKDGKHKRINIV
jgi:hypothetical protein